LTVHAFLTVQCYLITGIRVNSAWTYTASFYYRFPTASSFRGNAKISLQTSNGQIIGSANVALSGAQTSWKQVTAKIKPTSSPSATDNRFVVTVDGAAASGQTINFALFSLFPPTFKNRANGMRKDIAEVCNIVPNITVYDPMLMAWLDSRPLLRCNPLSSDSPEAIIL
jgi:hypothetical protein